jgi:DNA modification methylase
MRGGARWEAVIDLRLGDCLATLRAMPDASVDSVVTDPPYGLGKEPKARDVLRAWLDGEEYKPGGAGFMGKAWDAFVPSPLVWAECLRVLKPGGHLVAFAGSRTYDWIVMGVRLAGFEVRDQLIWMYGSGFPKSMDVSKAIDRTAGAEHLREFKCANPADRPYTHTTGQTGSGWQSPPRPDKTHPATDDARTWEGWGTALKPSFEPIVWARKPLNVVPFASILAECSVVMEALLWSISPAKLVETCSASSLAALEEESGSALWTAAAFNTLSSIGRSGVMDMCNSPEAGQTLWSIASSWSAILGESWRRMSTSTTRTETDLITAWKTCASLASLITPESTTRAATSHGGIAWNAESAGKGSTVDGWNLTPTPTPTAGALATSEIAAKVSAEIARIAESLLASSEDPPRGSASQRATTRPAAPDHSPIVLARKPLSGTVAANVLEHGTGAINVDGCRVGTDGGTAKADTSATTNTVTAYGNGLNGGVVVDIDKGRWPANILHDGSPEVLAVFPETGAALAGDRGAGMRGAVYGHSNQAFNNVSGVSDAGGSAARYFYSAKASRAERELGLADFTPETVGDGRKKSIDNAYQRGKTERRNVHPTVKPVAVMRWLARLVTPPGGVVLDPYSGSGTTGVAAALEGFDFIGCELSPEYVEIARARIAHAAEFPAMWEPDYVAPDEVPDEQLDLFGS